MSSVMRDEKRGIAMGRCPASSGRIDFAVRRHGIRRTLWLLTRCFAFIALAAWPARPAPAGAPADALGGAGTVQLATPPTASLDLGILHNRPESVARTSEVSEVTVKLAGAAILADPSIANSPTVVLDGWGAPSAGSGGSTPTANNEAALRPPSASWESASMPVNSGITLWRASVAALAATNIMDVKSSWGKREMNPALAGSGGTFGARGALLKAGIVGGAVALQFLILRHGPSKSLCRALAAINFGGAGLAGSSAVRNWRVADR
jgi:hypothetical protein